MLQIKGSKHRNRLVLQPPLNQVLRSCRCNVAVDVATDVVIAVAVDVAASAVVSGVVAVVVVAADVTVAVCILQRKQNENGARCKNNYASSGADIFGLVVG